MTPREALGDIRGYAAAGRIAYTAHALQRMNQRAVGASDVRSALANAASCTPDGGKWKTSGPDRDGEELTCVVVLRDGVVIVTVF